VSSSVSKAGAPEIDLGQCELSRAEFYAEVLWLRDIDAISGLTEFGGDEPVTYATST
jgi:hypothetical protein